MRQAINFAAGEMLDSLTSHSTSRLLARERLLPIAGLAIDSQHRAFENGDFAKYLTDLRTFPQFMKWTTAYARFA